MKVVLDSLFSYLRDNWPELLWIAVAAGIASYIVGRRARSRWRNRDLINRFNLTLTSIEHGKLRIRTIFELDCEQVFLNAVVAKQVVEFARRTTDNDPLLPIPEEENWHFLNAVLNEVSERFAPGQIKRDLGLPAECGRYLLCLTCERAGAVRTHKIRGMLVRKSLLTNLPQDDPEFEDPLHVTRWDTLRKMVAQYEKKPERFIEVEICV